MDVPEDAVPHFRQLTENGDEADEVVTVGACEDLLTCLLGGVLKDDAELLGVEHGVHAVALVLEPDLFAILD